MGDVFPTGDVEARFVVTLAMFANDLMRTTELLSRLRDDDPETQGTRIMLVRYQASAFHEFAKFVRRARALAVVATLVDGLPDDAVKAYATMTRVAKKLRPWLEKNRNVTFHYAELSQGKLDNRTDEVMSALAKAADIQTFVRTGENVGAGYPFADEVATKLFDITSERATTLREGVVGATNFALAAGRAYISRQGAERFGFE